MFQSRMLSTHRSWGLMRYHSRSSSSTQSSMAGGCFGRASRAGMVKFPSLRWVTMPQEYTAVPRHPPIPVAGRAAAATGCPGRPPPFRSYGLHGPVGSGHVSSPMVLNPVPRA